MAMHAMGNELHDLPLYYIEELVTVRQPLFVVVFFIGDGLSNSLSDVSSGWSIDLDSP